eukprot:gene17384-22933_t
MDNKNICSLGAGNEHSVLLSKSGKIYVCGYNENGQCGIGSNQSVKIPTIIHGVLDVENVTQIHAYNGCEHTIAITSDGKLYSFGYNLRGQLGLGGANSEFVPRLVKSLLSRKVVMASCSYHHSFFLCSDNSIYSCGRNDSGQLGLGDCTDRKTPQLVTSNITQHTINSMSCGQYHSMLLTSNNKVFVCGKNDYGQLGLDNVDSCYVLTSITVPFLDVNDSVTSICCGYYHSLLLTSCSMIYGFGRNDDGQLGLGHSQLKIQHITPILSLRNKNCKQISAGCYHTIVITSNGMLYVFGRNKHGQLGTGDLDERHYPHPVDDFVGYYTHWSLPIEFKTDNASNVFIFDKIFSGPDVLISSNGLVATYKGDENWSTILGSHPFSNGKSYWEIKVKNTSTAYLFIGVATSQADLTLFLGGDSHGYGYIGEQALYHNREKVKIYGDCFSSGDIIGVSLDLTNGILSYTKNQKPLGNAFTNLYGEFYPAVAFYNKDQELEIISSSYSSTCSPTIIPISLTSLNHYELSLIYEMMHCLHTSSMLSYISIRDIVSTVNEWCSNHTIRVKIYTGRTPYGTGEVIGTGFNRIWFKFLLEVDKTNSFNIWYFSEQQIYAESQDQIRSFKYGLESVIPKQALSLLTGNELEILICGIKEIDISRLRHNTEYDEDVTCNDKHIQNFWNILEYEFTNDERSLFLRFVWARPTLPPRELDFPQKFKIQSAVGDDVAINPDSYLPKAHTCFFSINLPKYSTKEIMIEKLKYAINNCTEMDADFRLTDTDIVGWGQGISSAIGVNPLSTMTLDDH